MKVRAQLKRHGRVATNTKHVNRLKAGHKRVVRLHVKHRAVASMRHHKHVWIRARVHAAGKSFVVAKFVRLHH